MKCLEVSVDEIDDARDSNGRMQKMRNEDQGKEHRTLETQWKRRWIGDDLNPGLPTRRTTEMYVRV